MRNESTPEETGALDQTIPVSHLSLDLDDPVGGWDRFLTEQGIDVMLDDLGRRSIARSVFRALIAEQSSRAKLQAERAALRAAEMAELERQTPVPAGVPAIEGLTAFEAVVASPGWVSPRDEFGGIPKPNWTEIQLAEGARRQAEEEAEAKEAAAARAKKALG